MVVEYREISAWSCDEKFVVDGVDMQLDFRNAYVGQIVQIALKEEVRPASRKSPATRLIAPYVQKVLEDPTVCCCGHEDPDCPLSPGWHGCTLCPNCVQSWCLDWFIRSYPSFLHGKHDTYHQFGCRCPECRLAQRKYSLSKGYMKGIQRPRWTKYGTLPDDRSITQ